ncbi:MAG TPA: TetR/AcrR family transcriptional regulator [Gemmatimonadales bacterium]|nr:TetR/AcrR family transcriptional regulator [Gemmatimonadales bacterium]
MTEVELTRRERKKEETKERILQAAFALFRKHGVEATTVEEISDKADVAKGTFFNYFPYKEAVFGYLSETWVADAEAKLAEILAKGVPAWTRVRDVFIEFASFYEEDRDLSKHMFAEWTRHMHDPEDAVCRRWDDLGVHVARQLQAKGELRRDVPPERTSRVLADVYHATIMMWLESPEPPFPLKDELRKRLTLVMEGVAAHRKEGK